MAQLETFSIYSPCPKLFPTRTLTWSRQSCVNHMEHTGEVTVWSNRRSLCGPMWSRAAIGPHDDLLSIVKTRKLRWYGHATRATGLANTIMQGTVPGGRRRGRPKKCRHDNIKEWTKLPLTKTLRLAEDRDGWRKIIKTSVVPLQPPNS